MKYCLGIVLSVSMSAILLTGCSKIIVVPVNPVAAGATPPPIDNGVLYALPKTMARMQIAVDKTTIKAAPFAVYAPIFAPSLTAVCKPAKCKQDKVVKFSLEDAVTFTTYGEPDPANVFLVKFSGGGAMDQSLTMTWNEAGLLSSASGTVTNRTVDIVMSGISLAAGVVSKSAAFGSTDDKGKVIPVTTCQEIVHGSDPATGGQKNDTDFIKEIQIAATDFEVQSLLLANFCSIDKDERAKLPYDKSLLDDAIKAYVQKIATLNTSKRKILDGTSNAIDSVALLDRVQTEINAGLIPLYIGTKTVTTWNGTIDARHVERDPSDHDKISAPILFTLDTDKGIHIANEDEIPPDGKAPPDDFKAAKGDTCDKDCRTFRLLLHYHPGKSDQLFSRVSDNTKGDRSFRYYIPAQVGATLESRLESMPNPDDQAPKKYGGSVFSVAQLGTMVSLPAGRHSKTLTYTLGLVEATGGLKTFTLGTTGSLDADTINSLTTSTGTVLDARNAALLKAATNADPATALTTQDNLLKLQDDICTIQQKYNLPCTVKPQ